MALFDPTSPSEDELKQDKLEKDELEQGDSSGIAENDAHPRRLCVGSAEMVHSNSKLVVPG